MKKTILISCAVLFMAAGQSLGSWPPATLIGQVDISAIIYVDADATGADDGSSWTDAFIYLQEALAEAQSYGVPSEIRVAQGIYRPTDGMVWIPEFDEREFTFQLINDVTINGGYAGFGEPDPNARDIELYETILSGDLVGNDGPDFANNGENSYHVVTGSGTDPNAVLDGFTITAGNANGTSPNNYGGGMYNSGGNPTVAYCTFSENYGGYGAGVSCDESNPTLTTCVFSKNWAIHDGGAIYCFECSPIITNCILVDNSAGEGGAIFVKNEGGPTISNNVITNNTARSGSGGAICCLGAWGAEPTDIVINGNIIENNFADESGGGIFCAFGGAWRALITDNIISNNTADGWEGGGIVCTWLASGSMIVNNTIANNTATYCGGGISCNVFDDDNMSIINNTIVGNSTLLSGCGGGGIFCNTGDVIFINNTIADNWTAGDGGGIKLENRSMVTVSNCILWQNTANGNGPQITLVIPSFTDPSMLTISYSDVGGGESGVYVDPNSTLNWGLGNIDADPLFVDPDANDFHLKSEAWRWDKHWSHETYWKGDTATSPCIDAGNPGSPLGNELLTIPDDPNHDEGVNLRINMGAFGGTAEASMPPYGWALLGDLTNDGTVDYEDLAGQVEDWLTSASQQPGDLNRDGIVDMIDCVLLAKDWMQTTNWAL